MTEERSRILIVDDKDNMRALLRDILSPRYEVDLAVDGPAALAAMAAKGVEVVFSDVRMPEMDGFELVRLIKERWPRTEIVMMTAFGSIPAAVKAMRLGAYDYIQKPFDPDDVGLVVARALERQREREAATTRSLNAASPPTPEEIANLSYREALASARDRGSREYLSALLKAFGGNVSRAAERAGLERESLHRLLRRHGIDANVFREARDGGEE